MGEQHIILGGHFNYDEINVFCCVWIEDTSDQNGRYR